MCVKMDKRCVCQDKHEGESVGIRRLHRRVRDVHVRSDIRGEVSRCVYYRVGRGMCVSQNKHEGRDFEVCQS